MTYDKAVYTIDFSQSTADATTYEHVDVTGTDDTRCETTVIDESTLEVIVEADAYVMPHLEDELDMQLPINAVVDCKVE